MIDNPSDADICTKRGTPSINILNPSIYSLETEQKERIHYACFKQRELAIKLLLIQKKLIRDYSFSFQNNMKVALSN